MLDLMGKRGSPAQNRDQQPTQQQQQQQQQAQPLSLRDLSAGGTPSVEEPFSGITDLSPDQVRRKINRRR